MNARHTLIYGLLGAPLAMAALPIYVYTPKLYGEEFGLGLTLTGLVLLLSRIVDTAQDPWLGKLSDYLQPRRNGWSGLIVVSSVALAGAFIALFNPPSLSELGLVIWLSVCLVLVYTAHSALNITYLAWGARASSEPHERTQIVASREGFGLLGVILASLLPMVLVLWMADRWLGFGLVFALLLFLASWMLWRYVPQPARVGGTRGKLMQPLRYPPFRRLATLFLMNGLAIAIAATLSLFYIADVLKLEAYGGALLALYFVSGALSLPLWLKLSKRMGKPQTWVIGSVVAVIGFFWASRLGAGDLIPYITICVLSGLALGADLALPASIAADVIPKKERQSTASYFGIWSLINKGVLALAAGLCLPLLALLGYTPGDDKGLLALAIVYAGIPCIIKLSAAILIWYWRPSLEVSHV